MALPVSGAGYQYSDGNVNEALLMSVQAPATVAAGDATLTAAQVLNGIILGSPGSSAAAYTLPTVANLEAAVSNARVGSAFDFTVVNVDGSGSGVITITTNTGWSIGSSGSQGLMTVAATAGTAQLYRARKTGDSAWALYRIA